MREHIDQNKVLYCQDRLNLYKTCGGPIKPKITFYGENLPQNFKPAQKLAKNADLLIIIGTSLSVSPFNSTVDFVPEHVPKVLINMENTEKSGYDFDNKEKYP